MPVERARPKVTRSTSCSAPAVHDGCRMSASSTPPDEKYGPEGFPQIATPDSGDRILDEPAWSEDDRPTVIPPVPDTRYTRHAVAVAAHLVDVHDHLRHELE